MIVSSEHKFVFVHIPKTGGRSIALALEDYRDKSLIKPWKAGHHPGMHSSVKEIKRKFPFCKDFCFFGFCRNPYDRMVSWYHGLQNHSPPEYGKFDFDTFVGIIVGEGRMRQLPPQVTYLDDFAILGRFENLEEDYETLLYRVGLPATTLPHVGKSNRQPWSFYYHNKRTRKLVEAKYNEDFLTFKYDKLE